jgi:hypothetical protein
MHVGTYRNIFSRRKRRRKEEKRIKICTCQLLLPGTFTFRAQKVPLRRTFAIAFIVSWRLIYTELYFSVFFGAHHHRIIVIKNIRKNRSIVLVTISRLLLPKNLILFLFLGIKIIFYYWTYVCVTSDYWT